jgi:glucosamine-6-phosphate deaminase
VNVLQFDSKTAWVGSIASIWRDRLNTKPDLNICLPSGATPIEVYGEMARSVRSGLTSFANATVFALDEFGGLSRDDPGRTGQMLQRQLIDVADLRAGAFRTLDPDAADLVEHCADYDRAIGRGFDLIVLGIGSNGHLGMNEPGASPDSTTHRADLHESTIQASARYFAHRHLPRWGLTVGLKTIMESAEVWLLATGTAKAGIIERTVRGEINPDNPASLLRRHPHCSLFLDELAGAALRG